MEQKTYASRLELKFADTENQYATKTFEGYGAVFNNTDFANDIIAPGAFAVSLAEHKAAGTLPAMFFNHNAMSMPIGVWTDLQEDDRGLKASGLFLDTSAGRDAYEAVKAGAVTGLSIGYFVTGFELTGTIRTITEAKLFEISVVTFPCNELARVSSVKNQENEMSDENNEDLKAKLATAGFGAEAITKLFESLNDDDEADSEDDTDSKSEDDAEDESEAKYNDAVLTAIKTFVATTKEMYVR